MNLRMARLKVAMIGFTVFLALVAGDSVDDAVCGDTGNNVCASPASPPAQALMQTKRGLLSMNVVSEAGEPINQSAQVALTRGIVKLHASGNASGNSSASEAPLNDAGYRLIAETYCHEKMETFIRRVIYDLSMEVCNQGGLSGFVPFFTSEKVVNGQWPPFCDLQQALLDNRPPAMCYFVAKIGECVPWPPKMKAECSGRGHYDPEYEAAKGPCPPGGPLPPTTPPPPTPRRRRATTPRRRRVAIPRRRRVATPRRRRVPSTALPTDPPTTGSSETATTLAPPCNPKPVDSLTTNYGVNPQNGAQRCVIMDGLVNPPQPNVCEGKVGSHEGTHGGLIMYATFGPRGCTTCADFYPDATAEHEDEVTEAWVCQEDEPPFEYIGPGICTNGDANEPVQFWFSQDGYTTEHGCLADCESLYWCSGFTIGVSENPGRCFLHFKGSGTYESAHAPPPSPGVGSGMWTLDNSWAGATTITDALRSNDGNPPKFKCYKKAFMEPASTTFGVSTTRAATTALAATTPAPATTEAATTTVAATTTAPAATAAATTTAALTTSSPTTTEAPTTEAPTTTEAPRRRRAGGYR